MAKGKLSERQKGIIEFIRNFHHNNGYPPTIRQIGEAVGISSTSVVNYNLNKLEKDGYLTRDLKVSRGLRLVEDTNSVSEVLSSVIRIPKLGRIAAGQPISIPNASEAVTPGDAVEITRSLIKGPPDNLFALEVRGNSMIDAMVNDGDIVVLKRQETARDGEMVAVWLADKEETTLKRFYLENGQVRLQPANENMQPIYADPKNVRIQGKVVLVVRQMKQ